MKFPQPHRAITHWLYLHRIVTYRDTHLIGDFTFRGTHYTTHSNLHHSESALYSLTYRQMFVLLLACGTLLVALTLYTRLALIALVALLSLLYFCHLLHDIYLIVKSYSRQITLAITPKELHARRKSWPTYTIFCPLYREPAVVSQFIRGIRALDYPKKRLQVILLLEEDDEETQEIIRSRKLPKYFSVYVVPHSRPKTKPKACNYGLLHATGEYAVIYDAEDIPEPDQLKKAVLGFDKVAPDVACLQAKLSFYNSSQNTLSKLFTAEYSLWFGLILPGLQATNAPIPLGGTSNHFRTSVLRRLDGWDACNVTEDCDLGMRIAKRGYRTAMLQSTTHEEANSHMGNWFLQRSRWVKGYIQSYWVHMRTIHTFKQSWREPHAMSFALTVGGKIFTMYTNSIMWLLTLLYFALRGIMGPLIDPLYPTPVLYMAVSCAIFGNFIYLYSYMMGCARAKQYELIKYGFLVPVYWLLMSCAAWAALYQLATRPHHWYKTRHGLHLQYAAESKRP